MLKGVPTQYPNGEEGQRRILPKKEEGKKPQEKLTKEPGGNLKKIRITDWRRKAQDREEWRRIVREPKSILECTVR